MIRQAHTYLAGAVSSTALVAAAVVAFVLLVSLQALKEWPLAGIGNGGDDSAVSGPSNPGAGSAALSAGTSGPAAAIGPVASGSSARNRNGRSPGARQDLAAADTAPTAATGSPTAQAPPSSSPTSQGGSAPGGSSPTGSASSSPASGGGNGGGGGSSPSTGGGPAGSPESGGQTTSGAITGTVNKTVSGVDEATGGVIGSTGVTEVTEKVVEGAAGPESTVGHTVDEVVKTVGGLLGGGK